MSGEKGGYNPGVDDKPTEDRMSRRGFLRMVRDAAVAVGAGAIAGGILEGCSSPDKTCSNQTTEFLFDKQGQSILSKKQERNIDQRLNFPALSEELKAEVEKNTALTKELGRISRSEAAIYYAVQYSASTKGLERKFSAVLKDEGHREKLDGLIRKYCEEFRVPYSIAYGVAANESGFDSAAESDAKAKGVYQVMDNTLADKNLQLADPNADDLEKNVYAGIKYLHTLYERYGQWSIAMMVYSTGPGNFSKKLRDKTRHDYEGEYGKDQSHWREFLKKYEMNAVTLYSKEKYGLGGTHPFQYPFYVLAVSNLAERIMSGEFKSGKLPDLISPEEFRRVCKDYPNVLGRIENKAGEVNAQEIFKRLKVKN